MLKAKLDSARKNKKGFSLVELIIVMAIMVALIAVLAPQFVKYVQRARDSSVSDAAENVYEMVKSEAALGNIVVEAGQSATILVNSSEEGTGPIEVTTEDAFTFPTGGEYEDFDSFVEYCGVDSTKSVKSQVQYTITITADDDGYYTFGMEKGTL